MKEKVSENKNQNKTSRKKHKTTIEEFSRNNEIFSNENASMLARNFKCSEDWKRLAYALGLFESDVSLSLFKIMKSYYRSSQKNN